MTQAIFLSYASQDADVARRICDALRAAGLEVWFDQNELRGGDAWDASIRKQIKECALFVPIISANTDARPEGYFRLEWKLAVDRSHLMADNHTFFFPVILDTVAEPTARVPDKFRERQWTRITDAPSIANFAERVKQIIAGAEAPRPASTAAVSVPRQPTTQRATAAENPSRRRTIATLATLGALGTAGAGFALWRPWQSAKREPDATTGLRPADPQLRRANELIDALDALPSEIQTAEELVKSVLATRPTDPEAVIMMSRVQNYFLIRVFDRTEPRFASAKEYAERALALAPESAIAKACLAEYLLHRRIDAGRALKLVDEAISVIPNVPRLHRLRDAIVVRSLDPDDIQACQIRERTALRFPKDALSQYGAGICYAGSYDFEKAAQLFELAIANGPIANGVTYLAAIKLWVDGDPIAARAVLDRLPDKFKTEQRAVLTWFAYSTLGGEAQAGLDALRALPSEWVKDAAYTGPTALLYGELLLRDGKPALAKPRFEEAYADWNKRKLEVTKNPEEAWLQPYLLMRVGQLREARTAYRLWATQWPRPYREAVKINWWLWSPITIGLIVGEEETALSLLRDAVEIPAAKRVLRTVLRVDWRLAPFRNNQAISKILADSAP